MAIKEVFTFDAFSICAAKGRGIPLYITCTAEDPSGNRGDAMDVGPPGRTGNDASGGIYAGKWKDGEYAGQAITLSDFHAAPYNNKVLASRNHFLNASIFLTVPALTARPQKGKGPSLSAKKHDRLTAPDLPRYTG